MNHPTKNQEDNSEKVPVRLSEKMVRPDFKGIANAQEFLKEIPDNLFDQAKVEVSEN